jgi:VanZ family protein
LVSSNDIPSVNIPNLDKLVHTFFHFVFTILWFLFFKKQVKKNNQLKLLVFSVCFSLLFGIGIEILQDKLTTTRSGDFSDVLANFTGAIMAFFFVIIAKRIRKKTIKE